MRYADKNGCKQTSNARRFRVNAKQRALIPQVLASLAAMCLAFTPLDAAAAELIRTGQQKQIEPKPGSVYDVYADRVTSQNVGVNQFSKFQVSKGDTVNLHYGKDDKYSGMYILANFVDSRIDINGVINTLETAQDQSIIKGQGVLYFLSKDGMTVGKDGLINAGAVMTIAPTSQKYDELLNNDTAFHDMINRETKLVSDGHANVFPVNQSGSIVVASHKNFNAQETGLVAAQVSVGDEKIVRAAGSQGQSDYTYYVSGTDAGKNIIDLYAAKIFANAQTAVNNFTKFEVDPSDTVNMYLKITPDSTDTGIYNLVNLVDAKININGTINLAKANSSLFFLSSEGMVVGADGVINAAAFYGLTPTSDSYNRLKSSAGDELVQLTTSPEKVPINPSGDITVNGSINTANGLMLRAGHKILVESAPKAS